MLLGGIWFVGAGRNVRVDFASAPPPNFPGNASWKVYQTNANYSCAWHIQHSILGL